MIAGDAFHNTITAVVCVNINIIAKTTFSFNWYLISFLLRANKQDKSDLHPATDIMSTNSPCDRRRRTHSTQKKPTPRSQMKLHIHYTNFRTSHLMSPYKECGRVTCCQTHQCSRAYAAAWQNGQTCFVVFAKAWPTIERPCVGICIHLISTRS
jgi:hypothetical protein